MWHRERLRYTQDCRTALLKGSKRWLVGALLAAVCGALCLYPVLVRLSDEEEQSQVADYISTSFVFWHYARYATIPLDLTRLKECIDAERSPEVQKWIRMWVSKWRPRLEGVRLTKYRFTGRIVFANGRNVPYAGHMADVRREATLDKRYGGDGVR
jgi:hypothetical protein